MQSLVHPYAAQIMDIVGGDKPRPAAPWGYTNTWGNNFCLLAGWLVVAAWSSRRLGPRVFAVLCLAVSIVPAVFSLNRGLWIGLGGAGRSTWPAGTCCSAGSGSSPRSRWPAPGWRVALIASPLGDVVSARLDNGKSNGVRTFLVDRALDGVVHSPVIGYGSTRTTIGGRNSITVGESAGCERCGNFTVGGNGQLWQLLYAHGAAGTAGYLGFFVYGLWRFRRDRSAIGIAASAAIVTSFSAMLWYNSLATPLAFMVLAYALLWRNEHRGER